MKFRVSLHKRIHYPGERQSNPFLLPIDLESMAAMSVRTWEFEARDEADVLRLLAEAREQNVEGVRGYDLRSIELVYKPLDTVAAAD